MQPEYSNMATAGVRRDRPRRRWAGLAILALVCLLAAWQGAWIALLGLPPIVWLAFDANRSSLPMPPLDAAPQPATSHGHVLMLERLLPVWAGQVAQVDIDLQAGTSELLDSFAQIMDIEARCGELQSLSELGELSARLAEQTERAMHGLQFSDRITQMLAVIQQDIERLQRELPALHDATAATAEQWLQELETRYTTDEQRLSHVAQAAPPRQDKVDFF